MKPSKSQLDAVRTAYEAYQAEISTWTREQLLSAAAVNFMLLENLRLMQNISDKEFEAFKASLNVQFRSDFSQQGVAAKRQKNKKQVAKDACKRYWLRWLEMPTLYATAKEWAEDMQEKHPVLESVPVIYGWNAVFSKQHGVKFDVRTKQWLPQ